MPPRQNLHRQIMLDEDERADRITDTHEGQFVEEFIAKFLRAVRGMEEKREVS